MPFQYRLPKLIIPAPSSKDQRWVVKYYVWSVDQNKLVMQRDLSCNKIADVKQRKVYAAHLLKDISKMLKDGWHLDEQKRQAKIAADAQKGQDGFMKLKDALAYVIKVKRSQQLKSIRNYEICYRKCCEWMAKHPDLAHLSVQSVNHRHIDSFMESLLYKVEDGKIIENPLSGRAWNNYLNLIKHLFSILVDKEIIAKNPCDKLELRRESKGRNIAYTIPQQKQLIEFMEAKYPGMLAFCQLMYYTLMRTNEISHMQAWWIGAYDKNKIYLPKEYSKNGQERHITIPPQLERIIQKHKWRELDPETYIFSTGFRPGKNKVQSKMHANKYRRWVLTPLKFSADYTMYSWKHTGVVFLYRNNIPRAAIRMQAGFLDDKSFEAYLKSLGLFENELLVTNYPSLPGNTE